MADVGVRRPMPSCSGPDGPRRETGFADGRVGGARRVRTAGSPGSSTTAPSRSPTTPRVVDATTGEVLYRANRVKSAANDALVWEQYPGAPNGGTRGAPRPDAVPEPGGHRPLRPVRARLVRRQRQRLRDTSRTATSSRSTRRTRRGGDPHRHGRQLRVPVHGVHAADPRARAAPPASARGTSRRRTAGRPTARRTRSRPSTTSTASATTSPPRRSPSRRRRRLRATATACSSTPTTARPRPGGRPDAKHLDNANMDTPPDGHVADDGRCTCSSDATRDFRDVNGGDDAAILYHEYTHGLSNRLVTSTPSGAQALNAPQAGAMGEGWSDFYAKDFLVDQFPRRRHGGARRGRHGRVHRRRRRTRSARQALDCPVGASAAVCPGTRGAGSGGYTYGDFGQDRRRGPEVHADGEIWAETLWDLRAAVGSEVARAIVTQGDAALAARADVPRRARRDPARGPPAVPAGRPQRRDLGRLRHPRDGGGREQPHGRRRPSRASSARRRRRWRSRRAAPCGARR